MNRDEDLPLVKWTVQGEITIGVATTVMARTEAEAKQIAEDDRPVADMVTHMNARDHDSMWADEMTEYFMSGADLGDHEPTIVSAERVDDE